MQYQYLHLKLFLTGFTCICYLSCTKSNVKDVNNNISNPTSKSPSIVVSTLAGIPTGGILPITDPTGMLVDASGNIYVAEENNNIIRKITSDGMISIFVGQTNFGFADGTGTAALLSSPDGMAWDNEGNIVLADKANNRIRKITLFGIVTTVAGNGLNGIVNGNSLNASFSFPSEVVVDFNGNIFTNSNFSMIREISPQGVVTTLAGSDNGGYIDGQGTQAEFNGVNSLVTDAQGNIFVADGVNDVVRKITSSGLVSTFAGSGQAGLVNGLGTTACFKYPVSLAIDPSGNIFVADDYNNVIRKITSAGVVSTYAGNGKSATIDGTLSTSSFSYPHLITIDASGNLYVFENGGIRKITQSGQVNTVFSQTGSIINGKAANATFNHPVGVATDASGNVFVADAQNNVIRKISAGVVSTYAGSGINGSFDGNYTTATFSNPTGLTFDALGNMYVADYGNNELRKISTTGKVSSIDLFVTANGASGPLNNPTGVCVNSSGQIYYTNTYWNSICEIAGTLVSTFSLGSNVGSTDGMFFLNPFGIAVDNKGNVYVADTDNSRICKILPSGIEITIAGESTSGNMPVTGNNDGIGYLASFNHPSGVAVDNAGNIYVADSGNNSIRKITASGVVTTLAGTGKSGSNDGRGTMATFDNPKGICVNATGTILYVADTDNNTIREISIK